MSRWEIWTWLAIAVLIFGSIGAFVWFLRDAVRLFGGESRDGDAEGSITRRQH
jgi:hypothetical protein